MDRGIINSDLRCVQGVILASIFEREMLNHAGVTFVHSYDHAN